jgi:hypothetical protein
MYNRRLHLKPPGINAHADQEGYVEKASFEKVCEEGFAQARCGPFEQEAEQEVEQEAQKDRGEQENQ